MITFIEKKKIEFEGFNLSCKPISSGEGFIATIRREIKSHERKYPESYNKTFILQLNRNFEIITSCELDESMIVKNVSYSEGLEDCRLINEKIFLCTALHTNSSWKPEMCYIEFAENKITRLQQLYIEGQQYSRAEKNWLFLKYLDENTMICMYNYNPFQIISVDIFSGKTNIIKEYHIQNLNLESHGGAALYLKEENQYLVAIRNIHHHKCLGNHFLLLNNEFELLGITDVFDFPGGEGKYQMCMSLILEEKEDNEKFINCFVAINDATCYVFESTLKSIIDSCHLVTMN